MAFANHHPNSQHSYGKQQPSFPQHSSFPAADDDFLMGGSVAHCDAQIQLGFLRKVRHSPYKGFPITF